MSKGFLWVIAAGVALVCLACNGNSSQDAARSGPPPRTTATPVFPPLDGPERTFRAQERTNYRDLPEFELPDSASLPSPSEDEDGPEFGSLEAAECPQDWEVLRRPVEGFEVCYPEDWEVGAHGYVTAGADDRWYALGLYRFGEDGFERAHVSIYMTTPYSQPVLYVAECEQAYQVRLDGRPASLCPDHPGEFPEAKIIAYHVRQGERDYFINVVPVLKYDPDERQYDSGSWSKEDEEAGILIAHSVKFSEPVAIP